jgi:hypothetical protein
VEELVKDVCPNHEKCVVLVDSLEKIKGSGEQAEAVFESVRILFEQHSQVLKLPQVHVVYSIAPFVLEQNRQLPALLGGAVAVQLPSVHVFERNSTDPDQAGVARLRDLLSKRFADWQDFFTPEQVNQVIANTGGDLRDFMRALQVCLAGVKPSQPRVNERDLEVAWGQIRPTLSIPVEHMVWMTRITNTHLPELREKDKISATLLEKYLSTKHILAYLNGETWYGLHPLVRQSILSQAKAHASPAAT